MQEQPYSATEEAVYNAATELREAFGYFSEQWDGLSAGDLHDRLRDIDAAYGRFLGLRPLMGIT